MLFLDSPLQNGVFARSVSNLSGGDQCQHRIKRTILDGVLTSGIWPATNSAILDVPVGVVLDGTRVALSNVTPQLHRIC